MTLEKLQVIIEAQTKAYYDELQKMQTKTKQTTSAVEKQTDKIKSAFGKIGKAVAVALSVTAIINFSKSCIELGSNLAEVQNVVDVTFGDMSDQINRFARDALTEFGLSETSAKKYTSTMGAMLKSMGLTTEQAADMSMTITGLSADMASFYNLDNDVAFEKIRSGISGETEPLKQLGINMSVANLQAYALSQGITKAYSSMTQQEQAMLRYNYLLSVTADAQGDFARTSDGWANQVRVLTERFNALKAAIGQGLIAVLTPVIRVLNNLLSAILTVTDAFSNMIAKITGKNTTTTTTAVSGISDSADDATDSVDSLTDATDSAGSSAKKASQEYAGLASFDEIHSLTKSDSSSDSSDSSSASSGLSEEIVEAATETDESLNPVLDKLTERLKELKDLFSQGFADGLGMDRLPQITQHIENIRDALKEIFTDPEVVNAANNYVNNVVYALGQMVGSVVSIGQTIAENLLGGIEAYLSGSSEKIKDYLVEMFDIGSRIATISGNFAEAFAKIFSAFRSDAAKNITGNIIGIFSDAFMGVTELLGKIAADVFELFAKPIIDNADQIKERLEGLLTEIDPVVSSIRDALDEIWTGINSGYDEFVAPVFDALTEGLSSVIDWVTETQERFDAAVGIVTAFFAAWEVVKIGEFIINAGGVVGIVSSLTTAFSGATIGVLKHAAALVTDKVESAALVALYAKDFVVSLVTGTAELAKQAAQFAINTACKAADAVQQGIMTAATLAWNAAATVATTVTTALGAAIAFLTSPIGLVILAIVALIAAGVAMYQNWDTIKQYASQVWTAIKTTITTVMTTISNGIKNTMTAIKTTWTTTWTNMKTSVVSIFTSIWNSIKGIINSIIGGIETMANSVVNGINTVIDTLNSLSFTIPDWVPGFGGKTWSMNIPKMSTIALPKLATGGIVDGATPLIAGEAGAEAIVPLERNTGWMNTLGTILGEIISVNVMSALEGLNTSGDTTVQTYVQIDGKTIVEQVDKYKNRQGYSMSRAVTT